MEPSERYLLLKRGLYYAPDRQGYTGAKARAGRYREVDALGLDGVTAIHEDAAPEFSPACWEETKIAVMQAEIGRLTKERDEAAAAERAKVVAFLRNEKRGGPGNSPFAHGYANAIEQGAHHDPE